MSYMLTKSKALKRGRQLKRKEAKRWKLHVKHIEEIFGIQQGEIGDVLENGRQEIEKEISEEKRGR